ncbi:alpha/beta hydrolase [Litoreibacter roseus]|nr:alpha/beta fold hydrolase [Litoreibacter roseus]
MRTALGLVVVLLGAACAERAIVAVLPPPEVSNVRDVWVVKLRGDAQATRRTAPPRTNRLSFERTSVSIPPTHQPGQIKWPKGPPDANTDFVITQEVKFSTESQFVNALNAGQAAEQGETLLFVHGYNVRHYEAVYQLAQMAEDYDVSGPAVVFSWPSAGVAAGYVYDRDSVLISRDALEQTIIALSKQSNREIILVGHSMGSHLIMETLRQIEIKKSLDIATSITALVLMAPDIDGEVFLSQVRSLDALPDPSILMVAQRDRALRLSAFLAGQRPRLGGQTDRAIVADLPISVIDVDDLGTGERFDHAIPTSSPAAIEILRRLDADMPIANAEIPDLVVLSELPHTPNPTKTQPDR